ncbi:hypothetical protein CR513_10057, partial [Mucuna pruriens]
MTDDIRRGIIEPCESWYDLKRLMRKRFMPSLYSYSMFGVIGHQLRKRSASRRSVASYTSWRGRDREKEKVRSDKSPKKGSKPF